MFRYIIFVHAYEIIDMLIIIITIIIIIITIIIINDSKSNNCTENYADKMTRY